MDLDGLPDGVLLAIMRAAPIGDVVNLGCCSRRWNQYVRSEGFVPGTPERRQHMRSKQLQNEGLLHIASKFLSLMLEKLDATRLAWMDTGLARSDEGVRFVRKSGFAWVWPKPEYRVWTVASMTNIVFVGHEHNRAFVATRKICKDVHIVVCFGLWGGVRCVAIFGRAKGHFYSFSAVNEIGYSYSHADNLYAATRSMLTHPSTSWRLRTDAITKRVAAVDGVSCAIVHFVLRGVLGHAPSEKLTASMRATFRARLTRDGWSDTLSSYGFDELPGTVMDADYVEQMIETFFS